MTEGIDGSSGESFLNELEGCSELVVAMNIKETKT